MVPWKWAASQPSQDESSPIWHQGSAWKGSSGYSGIDVAGTVVPFHDTVKLLGVTLDSAVTRPARHSSSTLLQLSYTCTAAHPSFVDIWCWQDDCTQHRIIAAGLRQRSVTRLNLAQNSLVRAVCQAPRSASATKLRRQLHWLPIRQRVSYKIAVITYKTWSTGTPAYLSHLIHDYLPARTLRSSEQLLLTVPRTTLALSAKAFSVSAPSVWNSLTYNCRSAELLSIFRCNLKTELFDIAYSKREHST